MTEQVLQIIKCEVDRQEITPGDSHKSTYRQGVDQVVNKFLFDMRGKGPLSVLTLFFQRKEICQRKANICHGMHVTTISGLYYFGSLIFGESENFAGERGGPNPSCP